MSKGGQFWVVGNGQLISIVGQVFKAHQGGKIGQIADHQIIGVL